MSEPFRAGDRPPQGRFDDQPPITEAALQAGLAELRRQLELEHPGMRFTFSQDGVEYPVARPDSRPERPRGS